MTQALARDSNAQPKALRLLWRAVVVIFVWSAIRPHDYFTWMLEVLPAIIGAVILTVTHRRLRFTTLVYSMIAAHMIILMASR